MEYIFIHGLGQTENSWNESLSKFDIAQAHCPNLPNLLSIQDITYEKLYGAFRDYCNDFSGNLNLCGLSLGGILALNYAIEFPNKVNSLVLVGTQYKMPKALLKFQNVIFNFMPKSMFNDMGFSKNDFMKLAKSMADIDFSEKISSIVCKTMIVCGAKDRANKKASVDLKKAINNSKLVLIEGSNHEVNVDQPFELIKEISSFYKEIGC